MVLERIAAELEELLNASALLEEGNLAARSEALDELDYAEEMLSHQLSLHGDDVAIEGLLAEARELTARLRRTDRLFFTRVRRQIASRRLSGAALRKLFDRYTSYEPQSTAHLHLSFDPLDILVAGIFHEGAVPKPTLPLGSEMISFQPSPVSAILELIDHTEIGRDDVFYDLGSGLGDITLIVALLTEASARGVEIDPVLCAYAQGTAQRLGVHNATFVNADARTLDYREGTVFYLFTPFVGEHLADVMKRIKAAASAHRVRIGTYGPITPIVANLPWLRSLNDHRDDPFRLAVLESRRDSRRRITL